jgi:hypothetical protein
VAPVARENAALVKCHAELSEQGLGIPGCSAQNINAYRETPTGAKARVQQYPLLDDIGER